MAKYVKYEVYVRTEFDSDFMDYLDDNPTDIKYDFKHFVNSDSFDFIPGR